MINSQENIRTAIFYQHEAAYFYRVARGYIPVHDDERSKELISKFQRAAAHCAKIAMELMEIE